jgi:2-amino-4-hydroxy-6-hydroxymethyldihydropteridine diphosphokinase
MEYRTHHEEVWIGLGSNIEPRIEHLREGTAKVLRLPDTRLLAASSLYMSDPVGEGFSDDFINGVLGIYTPLEPRPLLLALLQIEKEMGRDRETSLDRYIDLDILFYGERIIEVPGLTVPHPSLCERRFVLEPLVEVAPHFRHPVEGLTAVELLSRLEAGQRVEQLPMTFLP